MRIERVVFVAAAAALACVGLLNSLPPHIAVAQPLQNVVAFSQDWAMLTPSNTSDLTRQARAIFICDVDGGTVDISPWSDPSAMPTSFAVQGGTIYPLSPGRLYTSSTAMCVAALY